MLSDDLKPRTSGLLRGSFGGTSSSGGGESGGVVSGVPYSSSLRSSSPSG